MSTEPARAGGSKALGLLLFVALLGVAGWLLLRDDGAGNAPDRSGLVEAVCADVPPDMMVRTDAFESASEAVRADAHALTTAGYAGDADRAGRLADILHRISVANQAQEDTAPLLDEFISAFHAFGC